MRRYIHTQDNGNAQHILASSTSHEFVICSLLFLDAFWSFSGIISISVYHFARIVRNMVDVHLYDSTICRLCAAENGNEHLFVSEAGESDLSSLVNRYLPLKVRRCVFKTPAKRTATWFPTTIFVQLFHAATALIKCLAFHASFVWLFIRFFHGQLLLSVSLPLAFHSFLLNKTYDYFI